MKVFLKYFLNMASLGLIRNSDLVVVIPKFRLLESKLDGTVNGPSGWMLIKSEKIYTSYLQRYMKIQ